MIKNKSASSSLNKFVSGFLSHLKMGSNSNQQQTYKFPAALPAMDIRNFLEDPSERVWKEPFTFIQGADTQFGMFNLYHPKTKEHSWDMEIALASDFVQKVNELQPRPKFIAICGDMLDAYPHKKIPPPPTVFSDWPGGFDVRKRQYKDFVKIFTKIHPSIKLICTCGNHDMGDVPTFEALKVYRNQFGPDYFSFWVGGVKFVVLNSQYLTAPEGLPKEWRKQEEFIDNIADPNAKFIVIFQHIPFFKKKIDEPDCRQNLPKATRAHYLERFHKAGVRHVFAGHLHFNARGYYKDLEHIVTGAIGCPMGMDPSGYRIVSVTENGISHEYQTLRDRLD